MIYILLPFLVCILGLVMWAIASQSKPPPGNPYVIEGGRIMYACGLLVTLFACATHQITALSPAISASLPVCVGLAGVLVWILASNAVLKEVGKIAFAAGLLVSLFEVWQHVTKL